MKIGYTNPIRGMERRLAPDFAQREMRDPGLRGLHAGSGGLGSLHTMPHLRRLADGGELDDDPPYDPNAPYLQRAPGDIRVLENRMAEEAQAEMNERAMARGLNHSQDQQSARADVWHDLMQEDSQQAMDIRHKLAALRSKIVGPPALMPNSLPGPAFNVKKLAGGGNAVGEAYAASRPNLYNPDPMRRRILAALQFSATNPAFSAMPGSTEPLPYADGGEMDDDSAAPPDPQDLMQPEDQQSEGDGDERQVVLEAMAALEGQAEDPEEAIAHFIDTFGPRALKDLQLMVEQKHQQEQGPDSDDDEGGDDEEQPGGDDEEQPGGRDDESSMLQQMGGGSQDELAAAGGGLLDGPGTGQSDEIEATTPSGRPVLLSDGEYVIDAPTVAALGDGSTNAGARRLDALRKQIREGAYGHDKQAKPMKKGGSAGIVLRIP